MASIYLSKEELNYLVNELPDMFQSITSEGSYFDNIWRKCNDKLDYINCSKEMKKLNELEIEIDQLKKSIKKKYR